MVTLVSQTNSDNFLLYTAYHYKWKMPEYLTCGVSKRFNNAQWVLKIMKLSVTSSAHSRANSIVSTEHTKLQHFAVYAHRKLATVMHLDYSSPRIRVSDYLWCGFWVCCRTWGRRHNTGWEREPWAAWICPWRNSQWESESSSCLQIGREYAWPQLHGRRFDNI